MPAGGPARKPNEEPLVHALRNASNVPSRVVSPVVFLDDLGWRHALLDREWIAWVCPHVHATAHEAKSCREKDGRAPTKVPEGLTLEEVQDFLSIPYESELAEKTTAADRKKELKGAIAAVRDEIETLKKYSFLIGATDPYIVLPAGLGKADGGKIGDYALVIFGDRIFPAVVGDIGPSDKAGEASLRIAKEINAAATAYNRPVSDLKVTYLVFPGTADPPFGPPDLEKLQARTETLVKEIGGASVPLHHWENIIPPLPSPTPTPSSTPSASPAGSLTTPGPSPTATFAFPITSPSVSPAR